MGEKNRGKKVTPQYCQAIIHFRGLPKHLREWWVSQAGPQTLAETIRQYSLQYATNGEQKILQGLQRKLKSTDGCLPYPPTSKERMLPTPLGIMRQISRSFWYAQETSRDENPGVEFITWVPAVPRHNPADLPNNLSVTPTKAQFELF
jgi:predicted Rdx family selenoprotein